MKKYLLSSLLILASTTAFADCFNFINGKGPDRIGNFMFGGAAEGVCIQATSIRFYDSQGDLAEAGGQSAGPILQLDVGNINGENVDLRGTEIEFAVKSDGHSPISTGVLNIQAGRDFPQKYLIIKAE